MSLPAAHVAPPDQEGGDERSPRLDVLLFAAVPDATMLDQGFYAAEVEGLRSHPWIRRVWTSNRFSDVVNGQYDGLVTYFYSHSALTATIARLRGKPVAATGGGEQVFRSATSRTLNYWMRLSAFQLTALVANKILATSISDCDRMKQLAMLRGANKIELSFHGAPAVDRFDPADLGRPRPDAAMVTICNMDTELNVRRKGLYESLELLARFVALDPTAELTIIGRTTCQALVEDRARALGILGHVKFAGYVTEDQKLSLLKASRYYLQLSEYEGFGIGALEAMASGCHIIHTGVGGLRDTVAEFGTVVQRDQIGSIDLQTLRAREADVRKLQDHLQQFLVTRRADALVSALDFQR